MKKFFRFLCLPVLAVSFTAGLTSAQSTSTIQGSFVDIGFGARPAGMGFGFVGIANDANAVYWNPAGIAGTENVQTSFTHTRQFQLVNYQFFAITTPMAAENTAAGLAVVSSGDEMLRETSVHAAYAFKWRWLKTGVAAKFRNATFGKNGFNPDDYDVFEPDEIADGQMNRIDGVANGYGFDLGFLADATETIKIGLTLRDVFAPVNWRSSSENTALKPKGEYKEKLPFEMITGFSYRARENVLIVSDFKPALNNESDSRIRLGAEVTLMKLFQLRSGTDYVMNTLSDETYTFGLGILLPETRGMNALVDYAYVVAPLANTHRFSLAFRF